MGRGVGSDNIELISNRWGGRECEFLADCCVA